MAMADQGSLPVQSSLTEVCLAERRGHLSLERHECGRREAKWHFRRGIGSHRVIDGGRAGGDRRVFGST